MRFEKKCEIVKQCASLVEETRLNQNLSDQEAIALFVEKMKENKISIDGWFHVDEEIRKRHESKSWFWLIRRVRNDWDLKW